MGLPNRDLAWIGGIFGSGFTVMPDMGDMEHMEKNGLGGFWGACASLAPPHTNIFHPF